MRNKGQITLPVSIREEFGIEENEILQITSLGKKAIVIYPQRLKTEEILKKTALLAKEKGLTLEELLQDLEDIRRNS